MATKNPSSQVPAGNLGAYLLELNGIATQIRVGMHLWPHGQSGAPPIFGRDPLDCLRFVIAEYLVVKVHCFVETLGPTRGEIPKQVGGPAFLRRIAPITKRLDSDRRTLAASRHQFTAHGQRDPGLVNPFIRAETFGGFSHYGPVLLLAGLCRELMGFLRAQYGERYDSALAAEDVRYPELVARAEARTQAEARGLATPEEVRAEIARIRAQVQS